MDALGESEAGTYHPHLHYERPSREGRNGADERRAVEGETERCHGEVSRDWVDGEGKGREGKGTMYVYVRVRLRQVENNTANVQPR